MASHFSPPPPFLHVGPLGALSNDVTTLRTLIASLKTGVSFVRSLLAALPEVRRLLLGGGGGSVDVVKEAIVLLAMCRKVGNPKQGKKDEYLSMVSNRREVQESVVFTKI